MSIKKAAEQGSQGQLLHQDELQRIEKMKQTLESHQEKLKNMEAQLSRYTPMSSQALAAETQTAIAAEIQLLDNLAELYTSGEYPDGGTAPADLFNEEMGEAMSQMEPGFNDMSGALDTYTVSAHEDLIGDTYAGTIRLENTGIYDPNNSLASNALAFVADESVTDVIGKTIDKHVAFEVHYKKENGETEIKTYLYETGTIRTREPIYVYCGNKKTPINVDMGQVMLFGDGSFSPFGDLGQMVIVLGKGDDRGQLGQSGGLLIGGGGDDKLYGGGGRDEIYGDNYGGFSADDGKDLIDGGAGHDIIRAGGDIDQVMNTIGDSVAEHENVGATDAYEILSSQQIAEAIQGAPATVKGNTIVIEASEIEGELDIHMPDEFSMATFEPDSTGMALVITLVGFDVNGDPHTVRLKVNDYFDPQFAAVANFYASNNDVIMDGSRVPLNGQVLNLYGGDGDDTIIEPKTIFDALGFSNEQIYDASSVSDIKLADVVARGRQNHTVDGITEKPMLWGLTGYPDDGEFAWLGMDSAQDENESFVQNGEIVLEKASGNWPTSLNFQRPAGFDDGTLVMKQGQDLKVIFLKRTTEGVEQIVLRIKGAGIYEIKVFSNDVPVTYIGGISKVDGGDGHDTIFSSDGGIDTSSANNESIISGQYAFDYTIPIDSNESTDTQIATLKDKLTEKEKEHMKEDEKYEELLAEENKSDDDIKLMEKHRIRRDQLQDDMDNLASKIEDLEAGLPG